MASWSEFQASAPEMAAAGHAGALPLRERRRPAHDRGRRGPAPHAPGQRRHRRRAAVDLRAGPLGQGTRPPTDGRYSLHAHLDPSDRTSSCFAAAEPSSRMRALAPRRRPHGRSTPTTRTRSSSSTSSMPCSATAPILTRGRPCTPPGARRGVRRPYQSKTDESGTAFRSYCTCEGDIEPCQR